jgi:hypothetical protein
MPKRIQMTRRKGGWRKDHPDAVIVARPSKWGNPFRVGDAGIKTRQDAVDRFKRRFPFFATSYSAEMIRELRGKDLACWCPLDQPCHADVLLELANRPIASVTEDA